MCRLCSLLPLALSRLAYCLAAISTPAWQPAAAARMADSSRSCLNLTQSNPALPAAVVRNGAPCCGSSCWLAPSLGGIMGSTAEGEQHAGARWVVSNGA